MWVWVVWEVTSIDICSRTASFSDTVALAVTNILADFCQGLESILNFLALVWVAPLADVAPALALALLSALALALAASGAAWG